MSSGVQRILTIAVGTGVAVAGALIPALGALIPLGTLIIGTAIRHPADVPKDPGK